MSSALASRVRRFLRSPWTITAELGGIALAGLSTTFVDQHPTVLAQERLAEDHPALATLVRALGLDHVFTATWFLAIVALAAASLAIVAWEQWTRLFREWKVPGEAWFRSAPFRRTFRRAPTGEGRRVAIRVTGRVGAMGSPLFHAGLFLVAIAGIGRMLVAADASRDVVEGGVIPAGASGFERQDLGPLARPLAFPEPVRLVDVVPTYYPSGALLEMGANVRVGEGEGRPARIAVNEPLDLGGSRLYLTQAFGPAAVVAISGTSSPSTGAMLLLPDPAGDYSWSGRLPDGLEVRVRAPPRNESGRPAQVVDVRILRGNALLAAGRLQPGSELPLPEGGAFTLRGVRQWVRFAASRDPTAWPMFVGFAVAILGVVLMFGVARVDILILVEPDGEAERVTIAMRPHRLAPVFAERFERLVERESPRG